MTALEQVGAGYEARPLFLAKGDQFTSAYQALNPKGKVPLLITPEGLLTETLAIALYLHQRTPQAGLLPEDNVYATAGAMSGLAWCASTLHPLIYRLRMTRRIHPDTSTHDMLRQSAMDELTRQWSVAETAFADDREWFCGTTWSLADAYLLWCWQRTVQAGFDVEPWPRLSAWAKRGNRHPAWVRALQRENDTTRM